MTPKEILEELELAELLLAVDATRDPTDTFTLPAYLATLVTDRRADLVTKAQVAQGSEGTRAGSSKKTRDALDALEDLVKQGHKYVAGLIDAVISDADRLNVLITYGWDQGLIGRFDDARTEQMANLAVSVTPTIVDPAHRYPAALVTLISDQLAILNVNQPLAQTGARQLAIAARDVAGELLDDANERGRHYYSSASDDKDKTAELARIGRQPRRDPGEATQTPLPGPVGTVTFDEVNLTLSILELPENATTIRAFRQSAGGTVDLAGTSPTTTVTVIDAGPLDPDTDYEFWIVGHNSEGDGPESERIQYLTASAPPPP